MTNYFEELHKKGVKNIEMSPEQLQQLYIEGRITQNQFNKILMDNLGEKKFMELFDALMQANYSKDLLTKPISEELNVLFQPPEKF